MHESPRPDDLGDQRTDIDPEPSDQRDAADPRSEPGVAGAASRYPYWLIVGGFLVFALVALYIAWLLWPN
jgi:hypothetical protein